MRQSIWHTSLRSYRNPPNKTTYDILLPTKDNFSLLSSNKAHNLPYLTYINYDIFSTNCNH